MQDDLFQASDSPWPQGLQYEREFLTVREERALIQRIAALPLAEMRYRQYLARRRVVNYGGRYDFQERRLNESEPLPGALLSLRDKAAAWLGIAPEKFVQTLVAEYRPGTPLGWHRDVPDFEDVVGISLADEAVMRFRPYPPRAPRRADVAKLTLEPRSIYLLRGSARWAWQHSVAPTKALRYSVTFRTARAPASPVYFPP